MRHTRTLLPAAILALMVLYSCTNKSATAPAGERRATVVMRDGTRVPGAVVSSSPIEVTIAGDDKITRTIPMDQVKSIEYGEVAEAQPQAQAPAEAPLQKESLPVSPAPVTPSAAPSAEERSQPMAAPVAQTYDLPAGSRITIRTNEPIDSEDRGRGARL